MVVNAAECQDLLSASPIGIVSAYNRHKHTEAYQKGADFSSIPYPIAFLARNIPCP